MLAVAQWTTCQGEGFQMGSDMFVTCPTHQLILGETCTFAATFTHRKSIKKLSFSPTSVDRMLDPNGHGCRNVPLTCTSKNVMSVTWLLRSCRLEKKMVFWGCFMGRIPAFIVGIIIDHYEYIYLYTCVYCGIP